MRIRIGAVAGAHAIPAPVSCNPDQWHSLGEALGCLVASEQVWVEFASSPVVNAAVFRSV